MATGLENNKDSTIETIIRNLKAGVVSVLNMTPEEIHKQEGKNVPPSQAVHLNFILLEMFQAEALRRGMDYDSIGPNLREVEDAWLEERLKEEQIVNRSD